MNAMLTNHAYLNGLSALAERRYSSPQKAIEATLQSAAEQLYIRSCFLLTLDHAEQTLAISAAYNAVAESAIPTGARWPITMSATANAQLFAPLVLEDITSAAIAAPFLADPIFAQASCYISVPIKLADATVWGFLCGVDGTARQFAAAQIEVLIVLARHLAAEIELERERHARHAAEAQLAQAQATLHAAHRELERLHKLKRDFVTIVSHEFRTALTGIQGFSEIVRDEECSSDEVKEYAADINADARRLNHLITAMLDLDRMEAGKMKLAAGQVNLNALIGDLVTCMRPTAPRHSIQMQLDPHLTTLSGDSNKLEQALTQILHNAVRFSPSGGTICVSTRRDENAAHVSIQDNGIGIPAAELERIFERYARVEAGVGRYIQGTGMGLSIARDLIHLHNGRVWAESALDQGTTFHMTIPLRSPAAAKASGPDNR